MKKYSKQLYVTSSASRGALSTFVAKISCRAVYVALLCALLCPQLHAKPVEGKYFGPITIEVREIFDPPENKVYETANNLKIPTHHEVVRRELLFKQGDPYDPFLVSESERVLRSLGYLRDVGISEIHDGSTVTIVVSVQDTWTVIPQLSFSSGDGRDRLSVGASESNLFGWGKRIEALYKDDDGADTVELAYDDRRLFGTKYEGQFLVSDGSEGSFYFYDIGDPFRSLVQETAWRQSLGIGDTIERLYANGDERFVYSQKTEDVGANYAFVTGEEELSNDVQRISFGARYLSERFFEATESDFDDIGVDPEDLPEDGGELAEDRRFAGPTFGYEYIEEDFIKSRYIDRFSRFEDFNLGNRFRFNGFWAPSFAGSRDDALLFGTSFSTGYRIGTYSFLRWQARMASRLLSAGFENTAMSLESQYYWRIGNVEWGSWSLGNHTLATHFQLDYVDKIDNDKELLVGADNFLRGYDARTFTGDKRFALNVEDRIHVWENLWDIISIGFAGFAEVGGATTEPLGKLFADELYSNIGTGLRVAFPKSSGERVLRIDVAFPLRDGPDGSDQFEVRVIFSGGQLFSSQLRTEREDASRVGVDLGF